MNMSPSGINVSLCLTDPIEVKNLNYSEITYQTHYQSSHNPSESFFSLLLNPNGKNIQRQ